MRSALVAATLMIPITATAAPIDTRMIITALTGDWNGDGAQDLVMIVQTEPGRAMDVHFFLRDKERNYLKPELVVEGQVHGEWNGYDRPGYENSDTEPELSALPNGSIRLFLPAMPVGSSRTDETLTIAYRDGTFVVAGFAYVSEDALRENSRHACDYNVLTGRGWSSRTRPDGSEERTPVAVEGRVAPFVDWNAGTGFSACGD